MARLEIACFNPGSALAAAAAGADRIELCCDLPAGGRTPSLDNTEDVLKNVSIPVYVMIRPVGGEFNYTETEFDTMCQSLHDMKAIGVYGFVFGILTENRTIDLERNRLLVKLAHPLPCTFHRAFDRTTDPVKSLEDVIACGFQTILSSGLKPTAMEGLETLRNLVEMAGQRISIMPGGGVRSSNLAVLRSQTGADFFHSSAISSLGEQADPIEMQAMKRILE